jgi:hypothetical protein
MKRMSYIVVPTALAKSAQVSQNAFTLRARRLGTAKA